MGPTHDPLITLIAPFGKVFIPIFFVYAGMQLDIIDACNWRTLKMAVIIAIFAIAGKVVCGIFLPKNINKWIVGFGMVPRGEIGIIFALTGLALHVITQEIFAAILLMIIITSIVTPVALKILSKKSNFNQMNSH